ncbi:MAG: alpha/beta fold hydrolase [Candidatus Baltobacteraceae bacterium]
MKIPITLMLVLALSSPAPQYHWFASGDGQRIAYTVQGRGPAMLVVPGGPGLDGAYMRAAVKGLDAKAYIMDPRGTGASHVPETPQFINVGNILIDMERLRRSLHLQRWIVMGHSFGGYLAQAYAARYPNRVAALLLVSSSAPDLSLEAQVQREFSHVTATDQATLNGLRALSVKHPDAAMHIQMDTLLPYYFADRSKWPQVKPLMDPPHNSYAMARALYVDLGSNHSTGSLRALRAPVLAIYGQKDGGVDVFSRAIEQNTAHVRVAVVKDAGHFVWIEQPQVFRRTVNSFLDGVRHLH